MKFPFQKIFLSILVTALLLSCKKEKKTTIPMVSESNQLTTPSNAKDSVLVKVANLEDIPFELPKNWVYNRITDEMKKTWETPESGFVAIANDPVNVNFSVTVWEYEVDTLEELLPLFKRDMEALGTTVEYSVENGIIHGTTNQQPLASFRWKGKHINNKGKTIFVAVGSFADIYDDNIDYINTIFNSIYVP